MNDLMAIGVMEALMDRGFKVPQDVSVIGYDDISYASLPMISLSTIWQPKFLTGVTAVELLHEMLTASPAGAAKKVILQPELRVRNSTGRV